MTVFSSKLTTTDKFIYVALVLLALLGMAITNFSPADAHKYWLVMTLLLAIAAIMTGWQQAIDKSETAKLVTAQLFHWGATLIAVMVVYAFLHSGQIQNETVSLMILLILSLSTFLDGFHVGWHFSALGVLLAILTLIVSYVDEYLWVIVIIVVIFIAIFFVVNKYMEHYKK